MYFIIIIIYYRFILCILSISFLNSLYDTFVLNLFESVVLNVSMEFDIIPLYVIIYFYIVRYIYMCVFFF